MQKAAENARPSTVAHHAGGSSPRREKSPRHLIAHCHEAQRRNSQDRGDHGQGRQDDARNHIAQKKVDRSRAKRATRDYLVPGSIESIGDEVEP
jgi:hypothetical protein